MAFDFNRMLRRELNVGLMDQKIRYGAGSALLLASVFMGNILILALGAILVTTAYQRWCPVNSGFGRSTVKPGEELAPRTDGGESH